MYPILHYAIHYHHSPTFSHVLQCQRGWEFRRKSGVMLELHSFRRERVSARHTPTWGACISAGRTYLSAARMSLDSQFGSCRQRARTGRKRVHTHGKRAPMSRTLVRRGEDGSVRVRRWRVRRLPLAALPTFGRSPIGSYKPLLTAVVLNRVCSSRASSTLLLLNYYGQAV